MIHKLNIPNQKVIINTLKCRNSELLHTDRMKQILANKEQIKNATKYVDIFNMEHLISKYNAQSFHQQYVQPPSTFDDQNWKVQTLLYCQLRKHVLIETYDQSQYQIAQNSLDYITQNNFILKIEKNRNILSLVKQIDNHNLVQVMFQVSESEVEDNPYNRDSLYLDQLDDMEKYYSTKAEQFIKNDYEKNINRMYNRTCLLDQDNPLGLKEQKNPFKFLIVLGEKDKQDCMVYYCCSENGSIQIESMQIQSMDQSVLQQQLLEYNYDLVEFNFAGLSDLLQDRLLDVVVSHGIDVRLIQESEYLSHFMNWSYYIQWLDQIFGFVSGNGQSVDDGV